MEMSTEDEFLDKDDSRGQCHPSASSSLMGKALSVINEWLLNYDDIAESAYLPSTTNQKFDLYLQIQALATVGHIWGIS